jgi:hypothetical protein
MATRSRLIRLLLALSLWLLATAVSAQAPAASQAPAPPPAPRVGVLTMAPGEIFWERFGHNAIVIDDPAGGPPISYNFGFFDLAEPDFFARFVRGEMSYRLVALPVEEDLAYYRETGRGVRVQWLDLAPAQAHALAAALAVNARPENARYRYDYFADNCSTRVRDALDRALGGALRPQLASRSRGNTYRSEAVRLASPASWMWLGFDVGLGPYADRPLSRWEEGFIPMRLADSLREVRLPDGRPLVLGEEEVLPHRIAPEPAEAARRWWAWVLAGLALGAAIVVGARSRPRLVAALALPFWTLAGVLGLVLAFLWCCTAHRAGWANHNLLLLGPQCLLLLPGGWRIARGRPGGTWFRRALLLVAVVAALAPVLQLLPDAQYQLPWIALLLPVHLAFAFAWARR